MNARYEVDYTLIMLIVLALVSALVAATYFNARDNMVRIDKNGCLDLGAPRGHAVLIIDRSDGFTNSQVLALTNLIHSLPQELHDGDLLSIYTIADEAPTIPQPVFERCVPPRTATAGLGKPTKQRLQSVFNNTFASKLSDILTDVARQSSSASSPILEYIKYASARMGKASSKTLIVFSDLVQNTPPMFDPCNSSWPRFREFQQDGYYQRLRPNLSGVTVKLFQVLRSGTDCNARAQTQKRAPLSDWWIQLVEDAGARDPWFINVQPGEVKP